MKDNALAVANYFIELAKRDRKPITLLGLVKRVYIAQGFSLAIFHKSLFNPQFDVVEAWKYGPVVPCVYHSFKQWQRNPITEPTVVMEWNSDTHEPTFEVPELRSIDAKKIVETVWSRYIDFTDSQLVRLTHQKGSPWDMCYIEGRNEVIPDSVTELYYKGFVSAIVKESQK